MHYQKDPVARAPEDVYAVGQILNSGGHFSTIIGNAITTVEKALEQYKLEEICAGFNGGKDCTALVHLWYAVVKR